MGSKLFQACLLLSFLFVLALPAARKKLVLLPRHARKQSELPKSGGSSTWL